MNIVVRCGKKVVSRHIHNEGAKCAFDTFRHEYTDYDHKCRMAAQKDGQRNGPSYRKVANAVVDAALAISDRNEWVSAVREWAKAR